MLLHGGGGGNKYIYGQFEQRGAWGRAEIPNRYPLPHWLREFAVYFSVFMQDNDHEKCFSLFCIGGYLMGHISADPRGQGPTLYRPITHRSIPMRAYHCKK